MKVDKVINIALLEQKIYEFLQTHPTIRALFPTFTFCGVWSDEEVNNSINSPYGIFKQIVAAMLVAAMERLQSHINTNEVITSSTLASGQITEQLWQELHQFCQQLTHLLSQQMGELCRHIARKFPSMSVNDQDKASLLNISYELYQDNLDEFQEITAGTNHARWSTLLQARLYGRMPRYHHSRLFSDNGLLTFFLQSAQTRHVLQTQIKIVALQLLLQEPRLNQQLPSCLRLYDEEEMPTDTLVTETTAKSRKLANTSGSALTEKGES